MLLRRITQHVKDQNWFAVGLDFVIVVVGILIAFQITQWNETRGDRQRETQILKDIATDITADIEGYDVAIDNALIRIATIRYIFDVTPNSALSEMLDNQEQLGVGMSWTEEIDESVRKGTYAEHFNFEDYADEAKKSLWSSAILVGNVERSDTAFGALVNSGELGILRNNEIVRQLQEYQLIASAIEKSQDVTFRPARNSAIEVGHKFGLSVFSTVDEKTFLDLVGAEPELAATVQSQMGWATGHYVMLAAAERSAHELIQNIETELGEAPKENDGVNE